MTPRATLALQTRPVEYEAICLPDVTTRGEPRAVEGPRAPAHAVPRVVADYAADGWTLVTVRYIQAGTHLLFRRPLRSDRFARSQEPRPAGRAAAPGEAHWPGSFTGAGVPE